MLLPRGGLCWNWREKLVSLAEGGSSGEVGEHLAPIFRSVLAHRGMHDEDFSTIDLQSVGMEPVYNRRHGVIVMVCVGRHGNLFNSQASKLENQREADSDLTADELLTGFGAKRCRLGGHEEGD